MKDKCQSQCLNPTMGVSRSSVIYNTQLTIVIVVLGVIFVENALCQSSKSKDETLISNIGIVIAQKPKFADIERNVGVKSYLCSTRRFDRAQFKRMRLDPDLSSGLPPPKIDKLKDFIVWVRPLKNKAKIIGIGVLQDGKYIVFYADVIDSP